MPLQTRKKQTQTNPIQSQFQTRPTLREECDFDNTKKYAFFPVLFQQVTAAADNGTIAL